MDKRENGTSYEVVSSLPPMPSPTTTQVVTKEEQERIDFYNTYDVMTGVRIAATLGGFFGLMVLLVVYKSKSKTEKALEDPKLAAAAVAEAEKEERQIAAALEATAYEQLNPRRAARSSLDTSSIGSRWIKSTRRYSSVAGYSSLLEPPSSRLCNKMPCPIDEDSPPDDCRLYDEIYACYNSCLEVPNRRPSNITCSSSGSSYLERRGSSVILGLPAIPAHKNCTRRRQSSPLPEQQYDFYYPIDIRVINPTPGGSPFGSEKILYDHLPSQMKNLAPRLAPLASISSCNSSLANDYPDLDIQSYASDPVFHDLEYYADTDDEVDPFSTDSDDDDDDISVRPCCSKDYYEQRRSDASLRISQNQLPTISDESTSTLVEKDNLFPLPLRDTACASSGGGGEVWTQETLF